MCSQSVLKFIANEKPIFNADYAILGSPVRHMFMIATVWYLSKVMKKENLHILEVGSWVGASALSFAQGLKSHCNATGTITCVDAWQPFFDRSLHTDDVYRKMEEALISDTAYQLFLHNTNTLPKTITCQHLRGQSDAILPILREKSFDIIFVDANHTYAAVLNDIKNAIPLLKEGGILCGDDLNKQLHEVNAAHARSHADRDFVKDPEKGFGYHPGVTLAVAEVFAEVSVWGGYWAMQKHQDTWKKISLQGMPEEYPEHFPEHTLQRVKSAFKDIVI